MKRQKRLIYSVSFGFSIFILLLCVIIGYYNYKSYSRKLYEEYESYILEIANFTLASLDVDELKRCADELDESETYLATRNFMDREVTNFDIHYLYIIKPLNTEETGNVMNIISAETEYNRQNAGKYDPEYNPDGLLWLGWVTDDEYDAETAQQLFDIMNGDEMVFFEEKTAWGIDYTGAMPLVDSKGEHFAILGVDVDVTEINRNIRNYTLTNIVAILGLGMAFCAIFIYWARRNITHPIWALEHSVSEYVKGSHGQRNLEALDFKMPEIHTGNEIETLAKSVQKMTEDMKDYVSDLLKAESRNVKMQEKVNDLTGKKR